LSVGPLSGVRILEVASHVFVPMSGAVLTEWGAEVIKIEHPETGDPYRGLVTAGLHKLHHGVDPQFQATNRGKRSPVATSVVCSCTSTEWCRAPRRSNPCTW
jgi:crotonobetainyl-CoA:carnitine CoA-transferase CaiB-like acyl-CoA transferase